MALNQSEFEELLELRTGLRRFLHWSEQQAHAAGVTPAKHQLLLAIRGHADPAGPTIGDIADYLVLRHHSAVGLVDRAVGDGLVKRDPDPASKSENDQSSLAPFATERLGRRPQCARLPIADRDNVDSGQAFSSAA